MNSQKLPSLSDLFSQTFQIIKTNLKQFIGFYLIQMGITVAIGIVSIAGVLTTFFGIFRQSSLEVVILGILLVVTAVIIGSIIALWPRLAFISFISNREKHVGLMDSFSQTRGRIFPFMWLVFLQGLIILGGLMFFVIPGIFLFISFLFSSYILVLEKDRGLTALLRSHQYIKGYRLAIIGRMAVVFIASIIISLVWQQAVYQIVEPKSSITNYLDVAKGIKQLNTANVGVKVVVQMLNSVISNAMNLFSMVFGFLLYENIRRIKGDFAYTPSKGAKVKLIAIAIYGIAIVSLPAILLGLSPVLKARMNSPFGMLNPSNQFAKARDVQRKADLFGITNAIYQYSIENNGKLPDNDGNNSLDSFPGTPTCVGDSSECFSLRIHLIPTYIAAIPKDPSIGTEANTGYFIYVNENGTIVASAKSEVNPGTDITVERAMADDTRYDSGDNDAMYELDESDPNAY